MSRLYEREPWLAASLPREQVDSLKADDAVKVWPDSTMSPMRRTV